MSTLRLTNLQHTDASDPNIVLANNRTVALADGTASAPALSFQDDLDTGLYSPGANSIALGVGGSAILTIASTGNTTFTGAITTTSLSAQSTSTSSWFQTGTVLGGIDYVWATKDTSGNVWHSGLQTDGDLYLGGNLVGTTNIKLNGSDGSATFANNVGIGTSNPEEILHVAAASEAVNTRDGVMLQSTSALAADTGLPLVFTSHIGNVANYGIASIAGRKENATSGNAAGYLQFATGSSAGAVSEKVRIDSEGRILIKDGTAGTYADFTNTTRGEASSTAPKKIVFPNQYSTSNDDERLKIYLFNSGLTRQGLGTGNSYDLTYHSSGGTNQARHTFYVDETSKVTVNTHGLTFNGDTAAINALDDYEEGTWTVVPSFNSATTGITYSQGPTGHYTKIGRLVHVQLGFRFSSKGSAVGSFAITGLPFNPAGTGSFLHPTNSVSAHYMASDNLIINGFANVTNKIDFRLISSSSTDTSLNNTHFTNTTGFYMSLVYFT